VETKKLYATGAGSPSKVYCYSYGGLGRQKKIVELQGSGLTNSCEVFALGLVPPPSYSFAAVVGRWAAKHSFALTFNLGVLGALLFVTLVIGSRAKQAMQGDSSQRLKELTHSIRTIPCWQLKQNNTTKMQRTNKMNKAIVCAAVGTVLIGAAVSSRGEHNSCNQEERIDRWGCKVGNAAEHTRDYIRENAPIWREKINDAWTITKENAGRFGYGFKKGYRD
jgi:hypothetical protein